MHRVVRQLLGDLVWGALVGLVLIAGMAVVARAQNHESHAIWHDVYRTWKIPGTGASCCNAKYGPNGEVLGGDCYATTAEVRNGVWWVRLEETGKYEPVSDAKIIREKNPDPTGEGAHVCVSRSTGAILCFRPPNLGG